MPGYAADCRAKPRCNTRLESAPNPLSNTSDPTRTTATPFVRAELINRLRADVRNVYPGA
jgi:hypothetical protein